jgi:uncharacterized protein (DUF342 family)
MVPRGPPRATVPHMKANLLQVHLVQVNRHIVETKRHIAHQRKFIEELAQDGQETELAEDLLKALEETLAAFERHRRVILEVLYMPL